MTFGAARRPKLPCPTGTYLRLIFHAPPSRLVLMMELDLKVLAQRRLHDGLARVIYNGDHWHDRDEGCSDGQQGLGPRRQVLERGLVLDQMLRCVHDLVDDDGRDDEGGRDVEGRMVPGCCEPLLRRRVPNLTNNGNIRKRIVPRTGLRYRPKDDPLHRTTNMQTFTVSLAPCPVA